MINNFDNGGGGNDDRGGWRGGRGYRFSDR